MCISSFEFGANILFDDKWSNLIVSWPSNISFNSKRFLTIIYFYDQPTPYFSQI